MDFSSKNDPLGDRIKAYEQRETSSKLLPLVPVIVRLDGKAFHSFTKGLSKPYDDDFHNIMNEVTKYLVGETNALIGYTQSDEISLLLYANNTKIQLYFDGKIFKIISVLAAKTSVRFNWLKNMKVCENYKKDELTGEIYPVQSVWAEKKCLSQFLTVDVSIFPARKSQIISYGGNKTL